MATRHAALAAVLVVGLGLGVAIAAALGGLAVAPPTAEDPSAQPNTTEGDGLATLSTFESEAAFRDYVAAGESVAYSASGGAAGSARTGDDVEESTAQADAPSSVETTAAATQTPVATQAEPGTGEAERRVAGTNVQVTGVDEPDLVKADDGHFYYAPRGRQPVYREPRPVEHPGVSPPKEPPGRTHVIDTTDASSPAKVGDVNASGQLIRSGDTLVVLGAERIRGFDVSDPANPTESWSHPLNASLVTARLTDGRLYLVTRSGVGYGDPCPIDPLGGAGGVACTDVLRPATQVPVDATYTALAMDPASGAVAETTSFVGTHDNTAVYMSTDALYVTYTKDTDETEAAVDYLLSAPEIPDRVKDRVREIRSYDLSERARRVEIGNAVRRWQESLPAEEREQVMESFREGLETFMADRQRELSRTAIVRVPVGGDLTVETVGTVPGRPLNQFSLSQYDGRLRIATSVPAAGSADSANDLYVLDAADLSRVGEVQGMGLTERVYAVRYVGETAYVVTFRRVDPFHVVDLSDPANPEEVGKLKLPGYSSYLHPVDDTHVLGIGEEDGRVKTVLFDVSDPANPTIADDMVLEAHWSAVSASHHAFLQDSRHGVVFLPAGEEGLVLNYTEGSLAIEKRVRMDSPAIRARYVADSLYVFARDGLAVLDERTWERTATLPL